MDYRWVLVATLYGGGGTEAQFSMPFADRADAGRKLAARLTLSHQLTIQAEGPVHDISPAFPLASAQRRTAILQPPKPEIPPSSRTLELVADRDLDREAAD